jgi:hypothetical protein
MAMKPEELTPVTGLADLQEKVARIWLDDDYRSGTKHDHHAMLHIFKAGGKLAAMLEAIEHKGGDFVGGADDVRFLADVVICAARLAERWPGGPVSLDTAVDLRLRQILDRR